MGKTYNRYCDESCHLENDHKRYMFLGYISCAYNQVTAHTDRIRDIKSAHNFYAEIKWNHVSMSKLKFYLDLVDYFFATDLKFRAIGVDKSKTSCEDFDEYYYSMYHNLLIHDINITHTYNVYLDIRDTLSAYKVRKLKELLNVKYGAFRNVQNINSKESLLLQLADFILGALSYDKNEQEKNNEAKCLIVERIKKRANGRWCDSTNENNETNTFFIDLE